MATQDAQLPDGPRLVFETRLDAPPEKVWRALTDPGLRGQWLPDPDLARAEPVHTEPGTEIRYRIHDADAPLAGNVVAFVVAPDPAGGTILRIEHTRTPVPMAAPRPANANTVMAMRAA